MSVASSGQNLEDPVVHGKDGDIKGAAPKVKDQYCPLVALLFQTVGKRRCSSAHTERTFSEWVELKVCTI